MSYQLTTFGIAYITEKWTTYLVSYLLEKNHRQLNEEQQSMMANFIVVAHVIFAVLLAAFLFSLTVQ